jgi:2-oxoglutarate dehydrogenase E1 component
MKRSFRKPLVVMTPKSLLRHPRALSRLSELSEGFFQEVLDDPARPRSPQRLLLCTGKIFYDLLAAREKREDSTTAIVRIEQLYPFPEKMIARVLQSYTSVSDVAWVQEESRNRGAWTFVRDRFERMRTGFPLGYIGRDESATPATGSHARHEWEQRQIMDAALAGDRAAVIGK